MTNVTQAKAPSPRLLAMALMIREGFKECIAPYFRNLSEADIEDKGVRVTSSGAVEADVVTKPDKLNGLHVISELAERAPGVPVVHEEKDKADLNKELLNLAEGHKFILDDLDGSAWFKAGQPNFGVLFSEQTAGKTTLGIVLRTYMNEKNTLEHELYIADQESGVWCCPYDGAKFFRVKPFAERGAAEMLHDTAIIMGRYLQPHLLKRGAELAAKSEWQSTPTADGLILEEGGASVDLFADIAAGRLIGALVGPTRPWDHTAGMFIAQMLGGVAYSLDNGEAYKASRFDGGYVVGRDEATVQRIVKTVFVNEQIAQGVEPCTWDLLLDPTKERLKNEGVGFSPAQSMAVPKPGLR